MLPRYIQRLEILASFSELFEKDPLVYSYQCSIAMDGYKDTEYSYIIICNTIDGIVRKNGGRFCISFPPIQFVCVLLYLCLNCALVVNFAQNNEELLTSKNQPHDYNTASSGTS